MKRKLFVGVVIAVIACMCASFAFAATYEFDYMVRGTKYYSEFAIPKNDDEARYYVTQTKFGNYQTTVSERTCYYGVRLPDDNETRVANSITYKFSDMGKKRIADYKIPVEQGDEFRLVAEMAESPVTSLNFWIEGRWNP